MIKSCFFGLFNRSRKMFGISFMENNYKKIKKNSPSAIFNRRGGGDCLLRLPQSFLDSGAESRGQVGKEVDEDKNEKHCFHKQNNLLQTLD